MAAGLRELRNRRRSVTSTRKITKAQELIAASRVIKAQQAARAAIPFTREIIRAVSSVSTHAKSDHPLTVTKAERPRRIALVFFTSDRGMNGAFSSNVIKMTARLARRMRDDNVEVVRYSVGRKGTSYLKFRDMEYAEAWDGSSASPTYADAQRVADRLIQEFMLPCEEGGVDEIHAVYTRMESMLTQAPRARRLLPVEVVEGVREVGEGEVFPIYDFEPDAETVLDELMPLYVRSRVWFYMLQSAASQLAMQQRAMKSATDNATQLIDDLTRVENQLRQAQITQEITEIVGGASALEESSGNE
ncbi:F0F1 ATP synthase subunit gamma [Nigerium massiliense]|uniref:F0F1 ATP synthase subunit gamma n=1 Tax=Nigerium massiliense TaxID=1522317 RepID=UPI00058F4EB5|nr:F0F1 ATP synthase subunit gamma [Nigerium massiliense]